MGQFSGKYQYLDPGNHVLQEGSCRLQFDAQSFTLTPESGAPLWVRSPRRSSRTQRQPRPSGAPLRRTSEGRAGPNGAGAIHPRPTKGILVAINVIDRMFDESGRLAM